MPDTEFLLVSSVSRNVIPRGSSLAVSSGSPSASGRTPTAEAAKPCREKYVNIPSGKYIYVHKYVYICVYTYLCKMDENRSYAGLT